jgi:DNA repair protein RadC
VRAPEDVARLLQDQVRALTTEVFWVLHLDAKNCLQGEPVEVTRGLVDASLVHPREIFRDAVRRSTAAAVLAHNHPSGDPSPSAEDVRVTRQLVEAGKIVDIRVLDHVILGRGGQDGGSNFLSMREAGVVQFG